MLDPNDAVEEQPEEPRRIPKLVGVKDAKEKKQAEESTQESKNKGK